MNPLVGIIVSVVSGGLAGACISVFINRWFHRQDLRRRFYPEVNNLFAAYLIRMEQPEGRFWVSVVGQVPSDEDEEFVEHRSAFLSDIIKFTELKEARTLRTLFLENAMQGDHVVGQPFKLDLKPENDALAACISTLHKKLKI